jgi:adenylate kinase
MQSGSIAPNSGSSIVSNESMSGCTKQPHRLMPTTLNMTTNVSSWLLVGPPGSGKGTIGRALNALPGYTHWSSGDIMRAAVDQGYHQPHFRKDVISGQLLSDDRLWILFDEYFESYLRRSFQDSVENLLILDGIPRTRAQVAELSKRVAVRGILHFVCGDPDALSQRIARRFRHSGRSDDASQQVVRTRMQIYREQTLPLLDLYPADTIHRCDATQRPELVLHDVLKLIGNA